MSSDPTLWGDVYRGRVVVVVGGATGIGAAALRAFARAGAQVVLADVDDASGAQTVAELVASGAAARFVHCDVSVEHDVENLFRVVTTEVGDIDVVFANAGIEWTKDARHTDLEDWRRVLDVTLTGMFLVGRGALRVMCPRATGSLIMTTSPHALATVPDTVAYAASKGGVSALVRALALEAAPFGVRVNGVVPGSIDTPMARRELAASSDPEAQLAALATAQPIRRTGRPEDVAGAVLFLASPAADFVTGSLYSVDGGLMAGLPTGSPASYQD